MQKRWLLLILLCLFAVGMIGCGDVSSAGSITPTSTLAVPIVSSGGAVVVEGNIVPRDFTRVYTRTGGKVLEALVKEGDGIAEGATLVRMDGQIQAQAALSAAQLEQLDAQQALDKLQEKAALQSAQAQQALEEAQRALIEAQQKLDDIDTNQLQTDLDNATTEVNNAKDDWDDAQEEWDKNKNLDAGNAIRKNADTRLKDAQKKYNDAVRKRARLENNLNQARADVEAAQQAVKDAQREVDNRKGGAPDAKELALAQARLDTARSQVSAAQASLADLALKAPFAGTVVELDATPGETMLASQQLVLLADFSQWYVETSDLTEMDVVKVAVGDEATITPDALPETKLPATVEKIAQSPGKKGGDVTYTVRLVLGETDPLLRWGMTVEVRFK